jgi:prepilin peptidase CpaA
MSITFPLLALVSVATACDLAWRRIPNYLILSGLLFAFIASWFNGGMTGLIYSFAGAMIGLLIFIFPYSKSLIGGGDVKLMAAVGAFLGPYSILLVALYASLFGGLFVLAFLLFRGQLKATVSRVLKLDFSSARTPYAFAIFLGSCLTLINPTLL